jgi:hypothetical protein
MIKKDKTLYDAPHATTNIININIIFAFWKDYFVTYFSTASNTVPIMCTTYLIAMIIAIGKNLTIVGYTS